MTAPAVASLVEDPHLSREQKIAFLQRRAYDELELEVAEGEGMGGGRDSELSQILRALAYLQEGTSSGDARSPSRGRARDRMSHTSHT